MVIGELAGTASDDLVLLCGHLDSWDFGVMDNGSANATMLEAARVLAKEQSQLYSVRKTKRHLSWTHEVPF